VPSRSTQITHTTHYKDFENGATSTGHPLAQKTVTEAHDLIKSHVRITPVLTSKTLNALASEPRDLGPTDARKPAKPALRLLLKCEIMQRIGAFNARGACTPSERLKQEPGWIENGGMTKGVVGLSSGMKSMAEEPVGNSCRFQQFFILYLPNSQQVKDEWCRSAKVYSSIAGFFFVMFYVPVYFLCMLQVV
jgi:hypothetical protein